jgi:hypothetical protein
LVVSTELWFLFVKQRFHPPKDHGTLIQVVGNAVLGINTRILKRIKEKDVKTVEPFASLHRHFLAGKKEAGMKLDLAVKPGSQPRCHQRLQPCEGQILTRSRDR